MYKTPAIGVPFVSLSSKTSYCSDQSKLPRCLTLAAAAPARWMHGEKSGFQEASVYTSARAQFQQPAPSAGRRVS